VAIRRHFTGWNPTHRQTRPGDRQISLNDNSQNLRSVDSACSVLNTAHLDGQCRYIGKRCRLPPKKSVATVLRFTGGFLSDEIIGLDHFAFHHMEMADFFRQFHSSRPKVGVQGIITVNYGTGHTQSEAAKLGPPLQCDN